MSPRSRAKLTGTSPRPRPGPGGIQVDRRCLSVLVVDDERAIRELLADILGGEGHEVVCAPDAEVARRLVSASPHPFDAAFVDYFLPGEDGLALSCVLHDLQPDLPIILLTGDTALAFRPSGPGRPAAIMTKPFALGAIEEVLARVTAGTAHSAPPRSRESL